MQDKNEFKRRMMLWAVAGVLGAGVPVLSPSKAMAQDEPKAVEESRVPPAVVSTARSTYLDGRDVVYRKDGNKYVVNFTTPQNVRLQTTFNEDGSVAKDLHLAPNQPQNAPKRDERDRLLATWAQRVAQTKATPVAPVPPAVGTPLPRDIPALPPGELPPLPVAPVNTPVSAADLPPAVLGSFDRYTTGARDIRYYRQQSTAGRSQFEANYTHPDGSRRELVIDQTGSLVAGPMVLREEVADADLRNERVDNPQQQATDMQRIEARDVPARARQVFDRYTQRATDIRYRRDTYADRTVAYTVHWVQPDNGRRYFTTVREDGQIAMAPRLSNVQPDATTDDEGVRSSRIAARDLPDKVRQALGPVTKADRDARYYRQVRDGNKVFYGAEYTEGGKLMWVRTDEGGRTVAGPVAARGGAAGGAATAGGRDTTRPPARDDPTRDAVVANDKVSPTMLRDKIAFAEQPKAVQDRVVRESRDAKSLVTMRHTVDGKPVYHAVWLDRDGAKQELWQNERGEVVTAPRSVK